MRNYCTATPDFIAKHINECCLAHDMAYVAQVDKARADIGFYDCVAAALGFLPAIIIAGIASIGGVWFWYRRKFKGVKRA